MSDDPSPGVERYPLEYMPPPVGTVLNRRRRR